MLELLSVLARCLTPKQWNQSKLLRTEPNHMPKHAESNRSLKRSQGSALWFSLGHSALSVCGAAQWVSSCHALYIIIRSMHHPPSSTSTTSSSSTLICEFADCDYERSYRTAKRSLLLPTAVHNHMPEDTECLLHWQKRPSDILEHKQSRLKYVYGFLSTSFLFIFFILLWTLNFVP